MPRKPLVATRAALWSALRATGEARNRRPHGDEGDGQAQASGRSADRQLRACCGTHASHGAFTICDVTPMDKRPAGDDE